MAKNSSVKKLSPIKLIIMAIVAIALIVSVGLVKKNQENRSKAADGKGDGSECSTPGVKRCGGSNPQICSSVTFYVDDVGTTKTETKWNDLAQCGEKGCDAVNFTCNANYPINCTPGEKVCEGNILKTCYTTGHSWASSDCTSSGGCNSNTKSCNIEQINGECGSLADVCKKGIFDANPADTNGQVLWTCKGRNGGVNASCTKTRLIAEKVDGKCGSLADTCERGLFNFDPVDTATNVLWTCEGRNGGTDASCTKTRLASAKVDAKCSDLAFVCEKGIIDPSGSKTTSTQITWVCKGRNGGSNITCNRQRKINGVCDYSPNSQKACKSGTPDLSPKSTTNVLRWNCKGIDGGMSMPCTKLLVKTNGKCDSSKDNGCLQGDADPSLVDTVDQIRWTCNGIKGGINAYCYRAITPTPVPTQ